MSSLQRTPPPSSTTSKTTPSALTALAVQHLHHCSSEPNLLKEKEESVASASFRNMKRKYADRDENDLLEEMQRLLKAFSDKQEEKMDKLCRTVEDYKLTMDFITQKYESLKTDYDNLQTDRKEDLKYIKSLEDKLEHFERHSRSTCLEIRNIPSTPNEKKLSLVANVLKIAKHINVPMHADQVKDVYRIKSKDPANKTIIVNFTSVLQKEKTIMMFRQHNKLNSRLTTEHLKISGPPKPIFMSENLTPRMKHLFYLAREFAKKNDYQFCWVSNGQIFLRQRENRPQYKVTQESDLEKVLVDESKQK